MNDEKRHWYVCAQEQVTIYDIDERDRISLDRVSPEIVERYHDDKIKALEQAIEWQEEAVEQVQHRLETLQEMLLEEIRRR